MFNLPDGDLAIIGDTHQNTEWVIHALRCLKKDHPHIQNYIQVGDFGLGVGAAGAGFLRKVSKHLGERRMFVLLGNHDNYDKYDKAVPSELFPGTRTFNEAPNIHFFDRQTWFTANNLSFLAMVGANSINRQDLLSEDTKSGGMMFLKSWWREEQITDEDVANAVSGGRVDVLLCHDVPTQGFPLTEEESVFGRECWGDAGVAYAELSGEQLQKVLTQVLPSKVFHGHYHKRLTTAATIDGSSTETVFESLGMDGDKKGNIVILKQDGKVAKYVAVLK